MLYLLLGTNSEKRRELRTQLTQKYASSDAYVVMRDDTNSSISELEELLTAATLFGEPLVVVYDGALADHDLADYAQKHASELGDSKNHFIFSETAMLKPVRTKFEKYAALVEEFQLPKTDAKKPAFNTFSLTDAFAEKDKKKTWMLYRQAIDAGIDPREITGVLFWMIKSLILAKTTKNAAEAGLNPFVFSKAQKSAKQFTDEELAKLSTQLVHTYHKGQMGEIEFEEGLEVYLIQAFG